MCMVTRLMLQKSIAQLMHHSCLWCLSHRAGSVCYVRSQHTKHLTLCCYSSTLLWYLVHVQLSQRHCRMACRSALQPTTPRPPSCCSERSCCASCLPHTDHMLTACTVESPCCTMCLDIALVQWADLGASGTMLEDYRPQIRLMLRTCYWYRRCQIFHPLRHVQAHNK